MDAQNHLALRYISLVEVEIKVEETFVAGLEVTHTGYTHHIIKLLEVDIKITLTVEGTLVTIPEVVKRYRNNYNDYRRNNYRGQGYDRNRSRSLDRQDRSRRRDRSVSNDKSRSGSRASKNRHRIRCFECREYDHFARECLTRQEKRETEQIQQIFNLDNEQIPTQTLLMDIDDEETITLTENGDGLNL